MTDPSELFYTPQIAERPPASDFAAIDLLIHTRPRILRIKLAVLATQIQERLAVRVNNQERIAAQLAEAATKLMPYREPLVSRGLDESAHRFWHEHESKLEAEVRSQDVECWRDVAQAMNEFLSVWEAVQQSRVRADFLREQRSEDRE